MVWFTPGTVHRLVNDGELTIVTLMQNSGLPEAGDAVLTLPADLLADPQKYEEAATLGPDATLGDAYRRRDLAVQGLHELREDIEQRGAVALHQFYRAAAEIVRPRLTRWRSLWEAGAHRAARSTAAQLDDLENGDPSYLLGAATESCPAPVQSGRLGMCGLLATYPSLAHQES